MPEWSTACTDWADRLRAGRSIIPPPIFPEQAEMALAIFKELKIVDAPGSPTFGEACAQWVFDLVASIFGAYDPDSGRRLITEWLVLIPKKNSKSTIAAGIMMTAHILNWRQSASFTVMAPTIEVAGNSFAPARDMVQRDDELEALMHVQTHIKTITHRQSQATLKVLAADSNTVSGNKSVGTLVDELWLFGKMPDAENMFREALGGLASRPEGFVVYLTTQSDEAPAGVFAQKLQYARDVRDGKIVDPSFVPVIYELPDDMLARMEGGEEIFPEAFALVNPNLNYSVDLVFLERELRKARAAGPQSVRGFLAKHANVQVGLNIRGDAWAGAEHWERNGDSTLTLEELLERSEVVTVGIDGGGLDDLLGLSVLGRETDTKRMLHWGRAWAHASVLQRNKAVATKLHDFAKQGDLILVERPGQDVDEVADIVFQCEQAGLLDRVGVDPAGIGAIVDAITEKKIEHERIVGIQQGWRMVGSVKTVERWLNDGKLRHGAQPVMAWSVSNARPEARGNAVLITKQNAGSAKIDPLMALFNSAALMAMNPKPRRKKYQLLFA